MWTYCRRLRRGGKVASRPDLRQSGHVVRINRVYTRAGDDGTTALVGGQRVPKDSPRIEAYGTVDELNSVIGAALASGSVAEIKNESSTSGSVVRLISELNAGG